MKSGEDESIKKLVNIFNGHVFQINPLSVIFQAEMFVPAYKMCCFSVLHMIVN